ncbi:unnamed protein product [Diabrotica balteata]|uniref:Gastrula zinc finger protein XlCGF57.1-like n=1 Tax=Diabrotica balteata TaxID=107213 RepID=A0A9N9SYK4_DIABA|nr:unnamed protein product [Diabrotica balteata]
MYDIEIFDKDKNRLSISPEDLQNKCRVCLTKDGLFNIFETKENDHFYSDILATLSLLQVDKTDGMPQRVCEVCGDLVTKVHTFKQQIQASHVILQIALGQINLNSIGKPESKSEFEHPDLLQQLGVPDLPEDDKIDIGDENNKDVLQPGMEYSCSFCGLRFETKSEYIFHRKREERQRRTKQSCPHCSKKFFTYELKDHINSHTKSKPYECETCGIKFGYKTSLTLHNLRHKSNEIPKFSCGECGKNFFTKHTLGVHQKMHGGPPYPCKICRKSFSKRNVLKLHMRCHSGERPFLCTNCGAKFSQRGHLNTHIKLKHSSEKPFECNQCDKKFAIKSHLSAHTRTHSKDKSFLCTVCGKMFQQEIACKAHMLGHSEEPGILCNTCGQLFPTRINLFEHIRENHGELPFSPVNKRRWPRGVKIRMCELCQKQFDRKSTYEIHMRSHTGEKPFPCKECGKNFTQASHLYYHMKLHNGEKDFSCQFCKKRFTLKGNLLQHVRTHTGEKPFQCDICSKKFCTPHTLRRHKITHMPDNSGI